MSALFVLMAACGVVAAFLTPVARAVVMGQIGVAEAFWASAIGTLVTTLLGAFIGVYHYRRLRGVLWGILTGWATGLLIGPVILVPSQAFPSLLVMSFGGALLLIVVGGAFRLAARG